MGPSPSIVRLLVKTGSAEWSPRRRARIRTGCRRTQAENLKCSSASTALKRLCSTKLGSCRTSSLSQLNKQECEAMQNLRVQFYAGLLLAAANNAALAE